MSPATKTFAATAAAALVLLVPLHAASLAAGPPPHLLGGELLVYQMDARHHDQPLPGMTYDASKQGHHGTLYDVEQSAGRYGEGYRCNGRDHVAFPSGVATGLPQGTLAMWVYPVGYNPELFVKTEAGLPAPKMAITIVDHIAYFVLDAADGSPTLRSTWAVMTHRWTHLAFTWSPSGKAIFVDGNEAGSDSDPRGLAAHPARAYLCNDAVDLVNGGFEGHLDEVRLYDRVLTAAELRTIIETPYG